VRVGRTRPYARRVAVVLVTHVNGEIVHAPRHRRREAVDRRPRAEHRLELDGRQRRGVEGALAQLF